jgi:hypothetical protein
MPIPEDALDPIKAPAHLNTMMPSLPGLLDNNPSEDAFNPDDSMLAESELNDTIMDDLPNQSASSLASQLQANKLQPPKPKLMSKMNTMPAQPEPAKTASMSDILK